MATCFVIMPISTPSSVAANYGGDMTHFAHVLEHLFVPAIHNAGFEPIRPATNGSEVIQAHIIQSIQSADIVLCDITSLNANVFFELGIRTALNLPSVIIRDGHTPAIPFDTGIINHHTYDGTMSAWTLSAEIDRLSQHIVASANSAGGKNSLWHYFGISTSGQRVVPSNTTEDKLDYALHLLKSLKKEPTTTHVSKASAFESPDTDAFVSLAQAMADSLNARFEKIEVNGSNVEFDLGEFLITEDLENAICAVATNYGLTATIVGAEYQNQIKVRSPEEALQYLAEKRKPQ